MEATERTIVRGRRQTPSEARLPENETGMETQPSRFAAGLWAVILFIMGFLMPGVNNFAHAGGFVGGSLAALALGHGDGRVERRAHALAATAVVALTALAFTLAIWTALWA